MWSESFIYSGGFKQKGYNNTRCSYQSETFQVDLNCGIYKVNAEELSHHLGTEKYKPANQEYIYSSQVPSKPIVGDYRTSYKKIEGWSDKNVISMISELKGPSMHPLYVVRGKHDLNSFFAASSEKVTSQFAWVTYTWVLAGVSGLVLFIL